jgi:hypothetical protein
LTCELKTDMHTLETHPNHFIERFNIDKGPGGVWQAFKANCPVFIFFYPLNDLAYVYQTEKLMMTCNELMSDQWGCAVKQKGGGHTFGRPFPIRLFKDILCAEIPVDERTKGMGLLECVRKYNGSSYHNPASGLVPGRAA